VFYGFIGNIAQSETKKAMVPQEILVVDYDRSLMSKEFIENLKGATIPQIYPDVSSFDPVHYAETRVLM